MESSKQKQHHDVFIDSSSEDTRHSLVSHLAAAFQRSGISVFVGDTAVTTENTNDFQLPISIQSAIEGTKVFVVVFSENYASWPLCLETLVKFLERRKDGLVEVIPVFYGNVTPLMVEQQTESYGDAFSDLRDMFSGEHILRWRMGLVEAAKLKGHESNKQPM